MREAGFGLWLRSARVGAGLGLRELAAKVPGLSAGYLSRLERDGVGGAASEAVLTRVAGVLGADADEVLARGGRVPADVAAWLLDPAHLLAVRQLMRAGAWSVVHRPAPVEEGVSVVGEPDEDGPAPVERVVEYEQEHTAAVRAAGR